MVNYILSTNFAYLPIFVCFSKSFHHVMAIWLLSISVMANAQYTGVDPAGFSSPANNSTGSYYVSWNSTVYPVRVFETKQGISGEVPINTTPSLQGNIRIHVPMAYTPINFSIALVELLIAAYGEAAPQL